MGIAINYGCAAAFAVIFCMGEYGVWNAAFVGIEILALAGIVYSFRYVYIKTGIWKLTHAHADQLDEREIQVTHESYRGSFNIFTGVSLLLVTFMVFSVRFSFVILTHRGHYSFGLIVLIMLNYLAHTLPSSRIAWKQPVVTIES